MKYILLTFLFLASSNFYAQNLVPNPSFEEVLQCPTSNNNISDCTGWMNFGNSSEFFHICGVPGMKIPNTDYGYQFPNTGNGMAGIVTYVWESSPDWPNYRENIGVELIQPLTVGEKYFLSFFITHSGFLEGWQKIGANKIGMKFSTMQYSETSLPPLDNYTHLYTDSIYIDTVAWYKVSGSFIADEAYNYLMIGNFFDDQHTDTAIWGGAPFGGSGAYYFVDDVCVTTDSLYNEIWTGILENIPQPSSLACYPNPANDIIHVQSVIPITSLELINYTGQRVLFFENVNNNNIIISINHLSTGYYIVRANTNNQIQYQKVLVHH